MRTKLQKIFNIKQCNVKLKKVFAYFLRFISNLKIARNKVTLL